MLKKTNDIEKCQPEEDDTRTISVENGTREENYLHPLTGAAIIASWNTTSTLINFPYIFGILGWFGGVLFTLVIQGTAFQITHHLIQLISFYRDQDDCTIANFSDLGDKMYGKVGRRLFLIAQMSNQIGFLPYALVLMVSSLQALMPDVDILQCNVNTCIFVILFCFILVQVSRDWKDFHWLAFLTWFLATIQGGLLIGFATSNSQLSFGAVPTPAFVGMGFEISSNSTTESLFLTPAEQYSFLRVTSALGSIVFSFAPCFIIAELMSEMKTPARDASLALNVSFTYSSILYISIGLCFAFIWGNQVPAAVQSLLPQKSWESILSNVIILIAMVMDFVISVLVINRYIVGRFRPQFDYRWTCKNSITWGAATFIPSALTFILTLFIPNLEDIIGFVDAFSIPWAQFVLPVLFSMPYFLRKQRGVNNFGKTILQPAPRSMLTLGLFGFVLICGILFSLMKIGIFIYNMTNLNFSGSFWCEQVASL